MNNQVPNSALYLRIPLIIFGLFSVGTRIILNIINGPTPLHSFRFFTEQSNTMILIWTILAVLWANTEKYEKLTGFVKGALTTYITITFLIFWLVISATYHPTGIDWWTSLFNHYINPNVFVLDYLLYEQEEYQWKWPVYWLMYPVVYLIFAVIWSATTGEFLYSFLNYDELGLGGFFVWITILFILFYMFGSLYTLVSRKLLYPRSMN